MEKNEVMVEVEMNVNVLEVVSYSLVLDKQFSKDGEPQQDVKKSV